MAERQHEAEAVREAIVDAISSLQLGDPERVLRAIMRSDGSKTPEAP